MVKQTFTFTGEQLAQLLADAIDMYQECQDVHGYDAQKARSSAILDTIDGTSVSWELYLLGEVSDPGVAIDYIETVS